MPYRSNTTKIQTNIRKVIENRREKATATFVITPGGDSYYLYKGQRIPEKHFNIMFPTEIKKVSDKGENPCKKYAHD
jgi:hypothetical protein